MEFLRNAWYVAAWDNEVVHGHPLGRTFLNESIVLFRDSKNVAHALFDRCPHRFAPLHLGKQLGDVLQCAYHGLEFNGAGHCTRNPHGDGTIPKAAKVKTYPLVERNSLLWIWMGEAEKADPGLIPAFSCLDPETWYNGKDYLHVRANYQLEVDNIMDLSHIDYLHPTTLGGSFNAKAETEVVQKDNTVYSNRLTRAERLSPALEERDGLAPGTLVDRWLDVRWEAPGVMELVTGFVLSGKQTPRAPENYLQKVFYHLFTPETETTTHYWFSAGQPKSGGEVARALSEKVVKFLRAPFETEDLPMLEAQQRAMAGAQFWELKPVLLAPDAPGVRARRVLDAMIRAEQEAMASRSSVG